MDSEGTLPEIEAAWLENYLEQIWDKQIETDLALGKLDKLIAKAEVDIAANRVRNIDEILNNS